MKQILTIVICLLLALVTAPCAKAQIAAGTDRLEFRGGKLYDGGTAVTAANAGQFLPGEMAGRYQKALATERTGAVLMYGGGGLAAASGAVWALSSAAFRASSSDIVPAGVSLGMVGTALGAAVGIGGLVTYLCGRSGVRHVWEATRTTGPVSQVGLDFGATPQGLGLALRF